MCVPATEAVGWHVIDAVVPEQPVGSPDQAYASVPYPPEAVAVNVTLWPTSTLPEGEAVGTETTGSVLTRNAGEVVVLEMTPFESVT
jgi:hypothetical protein